MTTISNFQYNKDWSDAISENNVRNQIAFVNWWQSFHTKMPNPNGPGDIWVPDPGFQWPVQHTVKGRY